jgi:hypothetical protein
MNKWLGKTEVSGANSIMEVWDANYVIWCRFKLPQLNWTRRAALETFKAWSTPVIENKREKVSNRLIGYLSSRVSWPSLVTVPFTGDAGLQLITPDRS